MGCHSRSNGSRSAGKDGVSGGYTLSEQDKSSWINDLTTHTKEENDRAERNLQYYIEQEKKYMDNYDYFIRIGHIKGEQDPWWQGHVDSYNSLKAQLEFVKKQRKKLKR